MNLDNIAIALRPRSGWQSIDLGFKLARRWFLPLLVLWSVLSFPVYLLLKLTGLPGWIVLAAWWWLKPLYEAPLYYWCSRAIFAEPIRLREALAILPKKFLPLLSTYLLFWRFGTARSQNMNVIIVENLKGKARSARISIIRRVATRTSALLFVCIHIEVAIAYSLILTGLVLLPHDISEQTLWMTLSGQVESFWISTVLEIATLIGAAVVAPFYVCAGFSLYINRRTHLEAWDIALHFRRMVNRHSNNRQLRDPGSAENNGASQQTAPRATQPSADGKPPTLAASIVLAFLLATSIPQSNPAADTVIPDDQTSHRIIDEILSHEDFGTTVTRQQLQPIESEETEDSSDTDGEQSWLQKLFGSFDRGVDVALWIEGFLWLIVSVIFIWLTVLVFRHRHQLAGIGQQLGFKRSQTSQVQLFDLDIAPESLPQDIPATAESLLNNGQQREAMSLLYRGALSRLIHRYDMQINDSDTEQQCVNRVRKEQPQKRSEVFSALTRQWLQVAYGRATIDNDSISALCRQWSSAFDSARFDAPAGEAA